MSDPTIRDLAAMVLQWAGLPPMPGDGPVPGESGAAGKDQDGEGASSPPQ
jgi:hypothetical protein